MDELKTRDLGTWGYLRSGWWILHIVGIALFIYIGYYLGNYYR